MVARGTLGGQRTVTGTLGEIAERVVEAAGIRPPAITVVGPVAELRETLAWLERRPLHGEVVAVTRARAQASGLAARLRELGAEVVETPAIRIEPLPVELPEPPDLLCLTSPNGVRLYFDALPRRRARAGRHANRRDRAGHGGGAARARHRGRRRAGALRGGGAARGARRRAARRAARARRPRRRGARRAAGRPARARRPGRGRLALYETVAEPLDETQKAALSDADVRDLHLLLHRPLLPVGRRHRARRRAGRLDRPGHQRDAARARARAGRRGRAARRRRPGRRP